MFTHELASYEQLAREIEVTSDRLRAALLPADVRPFSECVSAPDE
jgi:hypothetical protein